MASEKAAGCWQGGLRPGGGQRCSKPSSWGSRDVRLQTAGAARQRPWPSQVGLHLKALRPPAAAGGPGWCLLVAGLPLHGAAGPLEDGAWCTRSALGGALHRQLVPLL